MGEGDDAVEDWNDEAPEWAPIPARNELEALQDLVEAAEFFCSSTYFSFEGFPGSIEKDGEMEIHNIHLLSYETVMLKLCKIKGEFISMALVPKGMDSPQIILRPPTMFMIRGSE